MKWNVECLTWDTFKTLPAPTKRNKISYFSIASVSLCSECNMRYMDDSNIEHNMKSICRAAVAQWTKRLARNGYTRVQIREGHIFNITLVRSMH